MPLQQWPLQAPGDFLGELGLSGPWLTLDQYGPAQRHGVGEPAHPKAGGDVGRDVVREASFSATLDEQSRVEVTLGPRGSELGVDADAFRLVYDVVMREDDRAS